MTEEKGDRRFFSPRSVGTGAEAVQLSDVAGKLPRGEGREVVSDVGRFARTNIRRRQISGFLLRVSGVLIALLFLLVWLGMTAVGYPHLPFAAQTIGVSGMTAISVVASSRGQSLTVTRAVTDQADLSLRISTGSLFSLSVRWEVLDYLGLLNAGIELSRGGLSVASGLFLGPVRFDWGRSCGPDGARWGVLTFSRPGVSVSFGIYREETATGFYGGIRLFHAMRWAELFARGRAVTISIGGLF